MITFLDFLGSICASEFLHLAHVYVTHMCPKKRYTHAPRLFFLSCAYTYINSGAFFSVGCTKKPMFLGTDTQEPAHSDIRAPKPKNRLIQRSYCSLYPRSVQFCSCLQKTHKKYDSPFVSWARLGGSRHI